jgi:hypothetical protein
MKIEVMSLSDKGLEYRDYKNILTILIDGVEWFSVMDGEPEDSNLSRDFNDCWNIPDLMKKAYEAGNVFEISETFCDNPFDIP